jgi:PAS domain S-box-containing protein
LLATFQHFSDGTGPDWADFRIVRNAGEVRYVHAHVQVARRENGQLIRCYGTTTDVTERILGEQQLKESEQRYRLLADHSSDMIIRVRTDSTVSYVSPACQKILGYEPEELLNQPVFKFIASADQERCREMLRGLFAGEDMQSLPYRGMRKDRSEVWLESKAKLLESPPGQRELLCVTRDITERRALEEQVAQAQRLEAIGRLAGGIAHDFNNILTVINGYAEILETRFPQGDPAAKYVSNIIEAGRRAALLTRQLLTYSRRQLVTRGQINLNDVIRKLEPLLRPLMGEEIEPVFRLDPHLGMMEGDVGQIEQLLMNLAINARDAMPEGGFLTIQTERVVFAQWESRPRNVSAGLHVKLVVADTGLGMDEATRARLFEPFFTTKGVGEGTGLGLATVYATVEQCGGGIEVEGKVVEGRRFEM